MLSNYKPESEWSEVNRLAAEHPVKVSPELFDLLSACVEYSRESEGAFDITVGPLMKVWGFYKGTGHLPHRAEIRGRWRRSVTATSCWIPANRTVRVCAGRASNSTRAGSERVTRSIAWSRS